MFQRLCDSPAANVPRKPINSPFIQPRASEALYTIYGFFGASAGFGDEEARCSEDNIPIECSQR